eukprot:COSAG06_NODE_1339_length_9813_cov_44.214639_10_plen_667_part_00
MICPHTYELGTARGSEQPPAGEPGAPPTDPKRQRSTHQESTGSGTTRGRQLDLTALELSALLHRKMSTELTVHARELLEAEIGALRAQVIALGGDPDDATVVPSMAAQPGDVLDTVAAIDASTEIGTSHDDGTDLGDLDLLPDYLQTNPCDLRTDEPECPYCESAAGIGGNRSKTPRKDNCVGTWNLKYGYTGPPYCRRCAEMFNAHQLLVRGKPRCGCRRDAPCAHCSKILSHFNCSPSTVHQRFDASRKSRGAPAKRTGRGSNVAEAPHSAHTETTRSTPTSDVAAASQISEHAGQVNTRKRKLEETACVITTMSLATVLVCVIVSSKETTSSGNSGVQNDSLNMTTVLNGSDIAPGVMSTGLTDEQASAMYSDEDSQADHGSQADPADVRDAAMLVAMVVIVMVLMLVCATSDQLKRGPFQVLRETSVMAVHPMRTVALAYGASIAVQLILAALVHVIEFEGRAEEFEDNGGFGRSVALVVMTFVGGSYGDRYPESTGGRVIIALVSTCGYLLQLFHIVLVVQTTLNLAAQGDAGNSPSAFAKFRLLMPIYLAVACIALILGVLTHAIGGITESVICDGDVKSCEASLFDALYLLWMTIHGTTFGEIVPGTDASRVITWLAMVINYFLTIGFAALTAIPNQQNYNFVNIPLLQAASHDARFSA